MQLCVNKNSLELLNYNFSNCITDIFCCVLGYCTDLLTLICNVRFIGSRADIQGKGVISTPFIGVSGVFEITPSNTDECPGGLKFFVKKCLIKLNFLNLWVRVKKLKNLEGGYGLPQAAFKINHHICSFFSAQRYF